MGQGHSPTRTCAHSNTHTHMHTNARQPDKLDCLLPLLFSLPASLEMEVIEVRMVEGGKVSFLLKRAMTH